MDGLGRSGRERVNNMYSFSIFAFNVLFFWKKICETKKYSRNIYEIQDEIQWPPFCRLRPRQAYLHRGFHACSHKFHNFFLRVDFFSLIRTLTFWCVSNNLFFTFTEWTTVLVSVKLGSVNRYKIDWKCKHLQSEYFKIIQFVNILYNIQRSVYCQYG